MARQPEPPGGAVVDLGGLGCGTDLLAERLQRLGACDGARGKKDDRDIPHVSNDCPCFRKGKSLQDLQGPVPNRSHFFLDSHLLCCRLDDFSHVQGHLHRPSAAPLRQKNRLSPPMASNASGMRMGHDDKDRSSSLDCPFDASVHLGAEVVQIEVIAANTLVVLHPQAARKMRGNGGDQGK